MSTPPPPVQKKRGLGCCGCGCGLLFILALLFAAFVGGSCYLGYKGFYSITSPTAATIPTFDGGDDMANTADQKVGAFSQAMEQHQPGSLQLSGDEMNTLLGRDDNFNRLRIHLFITLTNDQAHVQLSAPTDDFLPYGLYKDRYINIDATIGLKFDPDTRNVHLLLHSVQLGDKPIPEEELPLIQSELDPLFNAELQKNYEIKRVLNRAKTIEIKDGVFDIETQ